MWCNPPIPFDCILDGISLTAYFRRTPSSTVQCSTVYSRVQCSTVHCSTVQCSAVQYTVVKYSAVQYNTVHCSAPTTRTPPDNWPYSQILSSPNRSLQLLCPQENPNICMILLCWMRSNIFPFKNQNWPIGEPTLQ